MQTVWMVLCGAVALTACVGAFGATGEQFVSGMSDRMWPIRQGWGYLGVDAAWNGYGQPQKPLRIGSQGYARGLGAMAPGEILVELGGEYREFRAEVGVEDAGQGAAIFRVIVDGVERFASGPVRGTDPPRAISAPVAGGQEMVLVAARPDGEPGFLPVAWANARLVPDSTAAAAAHETGLDVAQFARVVTCDPHRTTGIRSNRFEAVAKEDIRLETEVTRRRGAFEAPVAGDGAACVGLVWPSRRRLRRLELRFTDAPPPPEQVRLECWKRTAPWPEESAWQGVWTPWPAACRKQGDRLIWDDLRGCPNGAIGTLKVRYVLTGCVGPVRIRSLSAFTRTRWQVADIVVAAEGGSGRRRATVEIVNGTLERHAGGSALRCSWDMAAPLSLSVRSWVPDFWRGDRTVLRIRTPRGAFGVAVDDVLDRGPVFLSEYGVLVSRADRAETPAAYRRRIAGGATMLAEVRKRPDQTRRSALDSARAVILRRDDGPTLISLPGENHKYLVDRGGALLVAAPTTAFPPTYPLAVYPRFGSGQTFVRRYLEGGWRPIPVTVLEAQGIQWQERAMVAPYGADGSPATGHWRGARPLCVVEFAAANPGAAASDAPLTLTFQAAGAGAPSPSVRLVEGGAVVEAGGRSVGFVRWPRESGWRPEARGGELNLTKSVLAGASASLCLYLPGWEAVEADGAQLPAAPTLAAATTAYWDAVMAGSAQVEIPDELVRNVILASQVHCLMASRSEPGGAQVAAWIGGTDYPALDSEAHSIVEGMDLFGHADYAQRCLDYFVARYSKAGYLSHGYTLMGTGWHLWVLGRHWELTHDTPWMKGVAAEVARACRWIWTQRRMTMAPDAAGRRTLEHGLMPPGVTADWAAYSYGFCPNGYYCAGLREAAQALAGIGHPEAANLAADAAQMRRDVVRAYRATRADTPVVPLRDGTWVPGHPMQAGLPGPITDFYPDDNMFLTALYDTEIGAHHLVHQGLLDPGSTEVGWILDAMEDGAFLRPPPLDPTNRPAEALARDPFGLGGYASMQPAYCHNMEIYAARHDVKPFVRSYLNAMAATLNLENLSFTENTYSPSSPNKTHTTGEFLRRSRLMLVRECQDDLWLAPCVTSNWMRDGMVVGLRGAPTSFGPVSYRLESHAGLGFIEAVVEVPDRRSPQAVVVRLRHPDGLPILRVKLTGVGRARIDRDAEYVRVTGAAGTIRLRAEYGPPGR